MAGTACFGQPAAREGQGRFRHAAQHFQNRLQLVGVWQHGLYKAASPCGAGGGRDRRQAGTAWLRFRATRLQGEGDERGAGANVKGGACINVCKASQHVRVEIRVHATQVQERGEAVDWDSPSVGQK